MNDEFVDLTRYVLEQEFAVAADEFEVHQTAVISIIGNASVADFERALKSLDYNSQRFRMSFTPSVGRWLTRPGKKLPQSVEGLILFSERSDGALTTFEEEIRRYWDSGITPLIAWPGKRRFADQIRNLLAPYGADWSFVKLRKMLGIGSDVGGDKFVDKAIATIEAILLPGVYPSIPCLDAADMRCVYVDAHLNVVSICTDRIEVLLKMLETEFDEKTKPDRILAVLYGPKELKLRGLHDLMNTVRQCFDTEDATCLGVAIMDARRRDYTLYVVTNE